jgi:hypothetical protein
MLMDSSVILRRYAILELNEPEGSHRVRANISTISQWQAKRLKQQYFGL